MSERAPVVFLSYARFDDEHEDGRISTLVRRLQDEIRFVSGRLRHCEPYVIRRNNNPP